MGLKRWIRRPPTQPIPHKSPVTTGVMGGAPEGCPDQVVVEGQATLDPSMVGQAVSLTLAGGRPQLVVAGRVAPVLSSHPGSATLARCLEQGERYRGRVTGVFSDRFEAELTRGD